MRKELAVWGLVIAFVVVIGCMAGCRTTQSQPQPARASEPARPAAKTTGPKVTTEGGMVKSVVAFPTGDRNTSEVLLEKTAPAEVALGQMFEYEVKVTNVSSADLVSVVLTEALPEQFKFAKATPRESGMDAQSIRWDIGLLKAGETAAVKVSGSQTAQGKSTYCGKVEYAPRNCVDVLCVSPALALTKTAPAEVCICDPIPAKIVVRNTGTGRTTNTKITDVLPDGLMTADGKKEVVLDVGVLEGGQSREFAMSLKASKTGQFTNTATATADGGLKVEATATTIVRQPVLSITKKVMREKAFIGQPSDYEITVSNVGDYVAEQTVLRDTVPAGATFRSASDGGTLSQGAVVWNLGALQPKASKTVKVQMLANAAGTLTNTATAEGPCAKKVSATASVELAGIPAILLEVVDMMDPVPVGEQDTYSIVVTNQGSADGTNIQIKATLEANAQYISSSGPTRGTQEGSVVTFAPLARLGAKEKAEWKVVVKAIKAGDVRFRVQMTSDQISRDVEETEATNFYE